MKGKNGKFADWKNEQLADYIPDVYCKELTLIDYNKLWEAGIRFISFDVDETIASKLTPKPSKSMIAHFAKLKSMGFKVVLLSNNYDWRIKAFEKALEVDGIARAHKPASGNFERMMNEYGVTKSEMAHVGNSTINDIGGANIFGITSCLVRDVEEPIQKVKKLGRRTEGKKIRSELKRRKMWYKHHVYNENDQYYQLGEAPGYKK